MKLSRERRAELRALAEKATPTEEWARERTSVTVTPEQANKNARIWYDDGDELAEVHGNLGLGVDGSCMARFLAASSQALPDALADLDELDARVKELERKHREQTEYAWGFESKLADAVKALEEIETLLEELRK